MTPADTGCAGIDGWETGGRQVTLFAFQFQNRFDTKSAWPASLATRRSPGRYAGHEIASLVPGTGSLRPGRGPSVAFHALASSPAATRAGRRHGRDPSVVFVSGPRHGVRSDHWPSGAAPTVERNTECSQAQRSNPARGAHCIHSPSHMTPPRRRARTDRTTLVRSAASPASPDKQG
jgi:hypothetical protein